MEYLLLSHFDTQMDSQNPLQQPGAFGWGFPLALAMVKPQGLPCVLKP